MNLDGKRVLITGASGGLGTATMAGLMEKGCKVVGIDKVASAQFKGDTIVADLMDEAQTEDAVAAAIERLGGLDVLINNAGVLDLQDPGSRPTAGVNGIARDCVGSRTGLCQRRQFPPGNGSAGAETGPGFCATTAYSAPQRPGHPTSPAPKPREVKDISTDRGKPDLCRTAWWGW
jgi:hypothetical protein